MIFLFSSEILNLCKCTEQGEVFSWGHGGHGQLGHQSTQNQKVPLLVESLAEERVTYIACGGSSSAAITGELIDGYCILCEIIIFLFVFFCVGN